MYLNTEIRLEWKLLLESDYFVIGILTSFQKRIGAAYGEKIQYNGIDQEMENFFFFCKELGCKYLSPGVFNVFICIQH